MGEFPCEMNGLCSEQFPAEKPAAGNRSCLICPKCNATSCRYLKSKTAKNPGRYFFACPATDHKFFKWEDEVKPHELIQVPLCGGCNAGVCRVRRETAGPNAGRIMFMCRVKEGEGSCGYRVWKDELELSEAQEAMNARQTVTGMNEESKQRDEGKDPVSPFMCPSADVICREVMSLSLEGISQSREVIYCEMDQFECMEGKSNTTSRTPRKRSLKGEASCSFRVWQDEVEMSGAEEMTSPFQSGILKCNRANITVADMDEHIKEGEEGTDPVSPFIEPSDDVICPEVISQNLDVVSSKRSHFNCVEGRYSTASMRPEKRPCYRDIIATSHPLESPSANQDIFDNGCGSIAPSRNSEGVESYRKLSFNAEQLPRPIDSSYPVQESITVNNSNDAVISTRSLLGAESYSKPTTHSIVPKPMSKVFNKTAECLQDEFLALLETMDAKDHEVMSQEAEVAFAALDLLVCNYEDFKMRVKELIRCASQLAEINKATPTNDSLQSLVEACSSERERLDRINCVHAELVEAETKTKKRMGVLQEDISSTRARLLEMEVEMSRCEAETRSLEMDLKKISKKKEVLEGKFLTASKEVEESQKLLEEKQAEQNDAEAKFKRAKALLRRWNKHRT